ncbi:CbtB-domain containing protein [Amycolatopsis tucumanensis]|uniref:Cobalt transporter subunit (CbtB) n=1 Tax=Amycolatopsis tucumanensis TaxID=401106 RepID=A0ABP7JWB9_9PSEU|nr:CbtB-domain containing protein [Amycolatopsis tucumanensis]MCF6427692.1 CbtB-domain containing protein [Amycolatopsis tucumanensis]
MATPAVPQPARPRVLTKGARDVVIAGLAVAIALLALYAIFLDQGALLSPVFGELSPTMNYIHEFAHDGRHLLAAPCH